MSENFEQKPEQELSIEEQVRLAEELRVVTNRRNVVESAYPDMDDLTVFLEGDPENRKEYDRLWQEYNDARKTFDEKVPEKLYLVKHLREIGKNDLANMIEQMFQLEKLKY